MTLIMNNLLLTILKASREYFYNEWVENRDDDRMSVYHLNYLVNKEFSDFTEKLIDLLSFIPPESDLFFSEEEPDISNFDCEYKSEAENLRDLDDDLKAYQERKEEFVGLLKDDVLPTKLDGTSHIFVKNIHINPDWTVLDLLEQGIELNPKHEMVPEHWEAVWEKTKEMMK